MATATFVAAAINFGVGRRRLARWRATTPHRAPRPSATRAAASDAGATAAPAIYVAIALSGLCALGAEVVWTRLLSLMLGATVYTFSIILAVFLIGLGIGSSVGSFLARADARRASRWRGVRLLAGRRSPGRAVMLGRLAAVLADQPVALAPARGSRFSSIWFACLWALLPAALLWGASFPLALAAAARAGQDAGRLVGGVYAANTVGAIVGAIAVQPGRYPATSARSGASAADRAVRRRRGGRRVCRRRRSRTVGRRIAHPASPAGRDRRWLRRGVALALVVAMAGAGGARRARSPTADRCRRATSRARSISMSARA